MLEVNYEDNDDVSYVYMLAALKISPEWIARFLAHG